MNKFLVKLIVPLGVGLFLIACNFIFSGSPSGGTAPDDSQVTTKSGDFLQLPLRSDVPPVDVIQQISLSPKGGAGKVVICESNCISTDQNAITLSYFKPNQKLKIDIYSPYNYPSYEFLTEIAVQADNNGMFELHVDRDPSQFVIIVSDRKGNALSNIEAIKPNQFSPPSCSGQLASRLAVGMQVQVISTEGMPVKVYSQPSPDPGNYLMDLAQGAETEIVMGPQCIDGVTWWWVFDGQMSSGWITEVNLEPVK